jgi:hypothetical protein
MTILCLGWGSLIWCNKALPLKGEWSNDGPAFPVEFARESRDRRITLVICDDEDVRAVATFWATLDVANVEDAKRALAVREGVPEKNICRDIGYWTPERKSAGQAASEVARWAEGRDIDGIVWTALGPKIRGKYRMPSVHEVIDHLSSLQGVERDVAEEYVRLAPKQIATKYRQQIGDSLDWKPAGRF